MVFWTRLSRGDRVANGVWDLVDTGRLVWLHTVRASLMQLAGYYTQTVEQI